MLSIRKCDRCSGEFEPHYHNVKNCPPCREDLKKERWRRWYNKPESKAKRKEYAKKFEERTRYQKAWRLKKLYGLSLVEYDQLLLDFKSRCAVCHQTNNLVVDHDHKSGSIRGILCRRCNRALGQLGDSNQTIERLLRYLRSVPWKK